jgi:hypothetical protein
MGGFDFVITIRTEMIIHLSYGVSTKTAIMIAMSNPPQHFLFIY